MENLILPNVSQRPRLTRTQWDLPVTSVSADAVKEKRHLDDIKEKRWPNLGGLLRPSSETNWRTVPQLTYKGMAMQASEAVVGCRREEMSEGGPHRVSQSTHKRSSRRVRLHKAACLHSGFWFLPTQRKTHHFLSLSTKILFALEKKS